MPLCNCKNKLHLFCWRAECFGVNIIFKISVVLFKNKNKRVMGQTISDMSKFFCRRSEYATLISGLVWARGKWESTDAGRSLVGASPVWLQAESSEKWGLPSVPSPGRDLWPWKRQHGERSANQPYWKNPYLPLLFPYTYLPLVATPTPKLVFLCLSLLYKCIALYLLRCPISPEF